MKRRKTGWGFGVFLVIAFLVCGLISCSSRKSDQVRMQITETENGTVQAIPLEGKIGDFTEIIVCPDEGYELKELTHDGQKLAVNHNAAVTVFRDSENLLSAEFVEKEDAKIAEITLVQAEHGTLSVASLKCKVGDFLTIVATPDANYRLSSLTHDGQELPFADNKAVTVARDSLNRITGEFVSSSSEEEKEEVSVQVVNGVGGSLFVTPERGVVGSVFQIIAVPDTGYETETLTHNGKNLEIVNNRAVSILEEERNIVTGSFKKSAEVQVPEEYTVTVGNFTGGTIVPYPSKGVAGTPLTLYVAPKEGYVLESLTYDGISLSVEDNRAQASIGESGNVVNANFVPSEPSVTLSPSYSASVLSDSIRIDLDQIGGWKGNAEVLMMRPEQYYQADANHGVATDVALSETTAEKVGDYPCGTKQSYIIDRYDQGGDRLYSKFYVVRDGTVLAGPFYPSEIDPLREKIRYNRPNSIKGVFGDDSGADTTYYDDLGANNTFLNLALNGLILPNEYTDASGNEAPIAHTSENTIAFVSNGKTYYFNKTAVAALDKKIKAYTDAGAYITLCLLLQANEVAFDSESFPESLRYVNQDENVGSLLGFNTSEEKGAGYFIAAIEFLGERYSRTDGSTGYFQNIVLGNELDFQRSYFSILPNGERAGLEVYAEEISRMGRMANLALKKYSSGIQVTYSFTHYWNKVGPDTLEGSAYKTKEMVDRLNLLSKAQGDYDWGLAPHIYGYSLAQCNYLLFDLYSREESGMTGDENTGVISFSNAEILQNYLEKDEMKFRNRTRDVFIVEAGVSSEQNTTEHQNTQAAMIALAYYKIASLSCVKTFTYYRLIDHSSEVSALLLSGLINVDGSKKPAYQIWKYIDTSESAKWAEKYVDYLRYSVNGDAYSSYREALNPFDVDFDWDFEWDYEGKIVRRTIEKEDMEDLIDLSAYAFEDVSYLYDLKEHRIEAVQVGETIEGLEIVYVNNTLTAPGSKEAMAVFVLDGQIVGTRRAVLSVGDLMLNHSVYNAGEEIRITVNGKEINQSANYQDTDWVGIYRAGETCDPNNGGAQSIAWFNVADVRENTVSINQIGDWRNRRGEFPENTLPAGKYKAVLFADGAYEVIQTLEFEVLSKGESSGYPDLSGIEFRTRTFRYDGSEKVLEVQCETIPTDIRFVYTNNARTRLGEQTANVFLYYKERLIEIRYATLRVSETGEITSTPPDGPTEETLAVSKSIYQVGEKVYIGANAENASAWVGIYKEGENADPDTGGAVSVYWWYLNAFDAGTYVDAFVQENNLDNGVRPDSSLYRTDAGDYYLPSGVYVARLFADGSYAISAEIRFEVSDDNQALSAMNLDKTHFFYGEDIVIVPVLQKTENDWIGLYKLDQTSVESIYWFYVTSSNSATEVVLQNQERSSGYDEVIDASGRLPAGTYVLRYIAGDASATEGVYPYLFSLTLEIGEYESGTSLPEPLKEFCYSMDDPLSGKADGTIEIEISEHYDPATEVTFFWGRYGVPLEGYSSFPVYKITSSVMTIRLPRNLIVPSGATELLARTKNANGYAKEYNAFDLSEIGYIDLNGDFVEFAIVSDTHVTAGDSTANAHFASLLADIQTRSNQQGLFIVGDVVDHGNEAEWLRFNELLSEYGLSVGDGNVHLAVGNHDLYNGTTHNAGDYQTQIDLFKTYANTDSVYYSREIAGYTFVFLGNEVAHDVDATLSETQLKWLDETLAATDPDRPVFVLLHQSIIRTVAGSLDWQNWDGVTNYREVTEVLSRYKQVVLFNGHSHWAMESGENLHEATETLPLILNTASVSYLWSDVGDASGYEVEGSQGYYVRIYSDKIVILGRNFVSGTYVANACYVFDAF